ncbi:MAG TPA: nucleotidyltransferase domain-containing protein [Candidatus Thermoplasmatota archaeon]|jgi:predicted nucleotidyltransferase|nr:nucleotidyltransferase domain-containing protein [Candidatus Thermoplasmatota archaeon]
MMPSLTWVDPVLGSTAKVRVLRALSRAPDRVFTEAELARAVRMSPNTVNLAVRDLARAGVVDIRAAGHAHEVRLEQASLLGQAVVELFRAEAGGLDHLARAVRGALKRGESCVLFGSAARGTMTASSDIDLLIVAPTWDAAAEASVRIGQAARRVWPTRYHALHYTPTELRKKWGTPLLRAVREEGVLLGGKPLEEYV